jgi:predicted NAD/FAD-binding protein
MAQNDPLTMDPTPRTAHPITRRRFVAGAAAVAALGAGGALAGRAGASPVRPVRAARSRAGRVAIIGAGAGGIAAAYFLDGTHEVELFESRSKIGGHCDTHVIAYGGQRVTVDLGAQFFGPATHPIYVTLLEQLGLYTTPASSTDATLVEPASLSILPTGAGAPVFFSGAALATPQLAVQFAQFIPLARQAVLSNLAWETTVATWVAGLAVSPAFKTQLLLPWLTALIGSSHADALRASARSILQTFALSFPADLSQGATTYNSTLGLQGNLERMLAHSPGVRVHLNAPATALKRTRAGWYLETPGASHGPYETVVLNAPAQAGHQLVRGLPAFASLARVLGAYEYFDARLLIHTDPAYVSADRSDWASYNAQVRGVQCEGSVWYGALKPKLASGQTIDVFKSWATRRAADPEHILLERTFQHPVINPAAIRAARALRSHQGRGGLYFSGQYTTGFDAQESAVYSAMKLAETLAPASRTLSALRTRLGAAGLAGISYDL